MASRHDSPLFPVANLSPAFQLIDVDLKATEQDVAALKAGGGGGGTGGTVDWSAITSKPTFATVATSGAYTDLTAKPDLTVYAPKASPTFTGTVALGGATVTGLTKATVGLGNVDNTADSAKTFTAAQTTSGVFAPARLGSGTASASTFLTGASTYVALTKSTVGLGNVDNTADAAKTFAASQVTTGTFDPARLGTGAGTAGDRFLADDGAYKTVTAGGGGTDITTSQNSDGTWPTITRTTGIHYRWFAGYDGTKLPTYANGAASGDELVTPTGTTVVA